MSRYGKRGGDGPNTGKKATTYEIVLPDGTKVRKRVFNPRGGDTLVATGIRGLDGRPETNGDLNMKLGIETGSLVTHVVTTSAQPTPVVGMGATICMWSDRHAGTVIKVTRTQVHVQEDKATRVDSNGLSEDQNYTYERNPNGRVHVFRKRRRDGRYVCSGNGLWLGVRREYYDFSF